MKDRRILNLVVILSAFFTLFVAACQLQASPTVHYTGTVKDSNAFVAIATNGRDILAYVCDGTEADVTIADWFRGTLSEQAFELTAQNTDRLQGQIDDVTANGTLALTDGSMLTFSASLATDEAGLYRNEETVSGSAQVSGWIVLQDGQVRGATLPVGGLPGCPGICGNTGPYFYLWRWHW